MSSTIQSVRKTTRRGAPQSPQTLGSVLGNRVKTLKGRFILQAGLILLLAGIMTLVASTSLNRASADLDTINSGSIPSVNYAQAISQLISSIDAQSADYLATAGLTDQGSCKLANNTTAADLLTVHDCDERNIDLEIVQVNEQLFNAAHNTTYPGEQTAVERISTGLESYLGQINLMRVEYGQAKSKTDPSDPNLHQAYLAYLAAGKILHEQISLTTVNANQIPLDPENSQLPSCKSSSGNTYYSPDQWTKGSLTQALDCLSDINHQALSNAYDDASGFLGGNYWLLLFLGLLIGALLIYSTGSMTASTHRLINPGLLPAALVVVILSFNTVGLVGNLGKQPNGAALQDGAFRQMVKDDYDSVYYAKLLRRFATDANADESRWLIAQDFNDTGMIQQWESDWKNNVQQVTNLMQQANTNQTWDEEVKPLADMKQFWDQYYGIDGQIRSAATNQADPNHVLTAEKLSTGDSNNAFGGFTDAVDALAQANQSHYDSTYSDTKASLGLYFILSLVLFPLAGLLGAWGIWLRLKDF